jgi:ribosome-binding protein aMBF1 (putative translation factor)
MAEPQTIRIGRAEYVVIPKAEYLRLRDRGLPAGTVDAIEYARKSIATNLRAAREAAGLTQAALADKLGVSQSMVSQGESATMRVSERYVRAVLKACGLPEDWGGKKPSKAKRGRKAVGSKQTLRSARRRPGPGPAR